MNADRWRQIAGVGMACAVTMVATALVTLGSVGPVLDDDLRGASASWREASRLAAEARADYEAASATYREVAAHCDERDQPTVAEASSQPGSHSRVPARPSAPPREAAPRDVLADDGGVDPIGGAEEDSRERRRIVRHGREPSRGHLDDDPLGGLDV